MTKPVRLRLSRAKGFNLQALSIATNGLPAVNCARPSKWGNRFVVGAHGLTCAEADTLAHYADYRKNVDLWDRWPLADAKTAVRAFREMQCRGTFLKMVKAELPGKNLACWCADGPCHCDVLLELANAPGSPA